MLSADDTLIVLFTLFFRSRRETITNFVRSVCSRAYCACVEHHSIFFFFFSVSFRFFARLTLAARFSLSFFGVLTIEQT